MQYILHSQAYQTCCTKDNTRFCQNCNRLDEISFKKRWRGCNIKRLDSFDEFTHYSDILEGFPFI